MTAVRRRSLLVAALCALTVALVSWGSVGIEVRAAVTPPVIVGEGSMNGGTRVTITGAGFAGATAVMFDTTPAVWFRVESDTKITAASPPHPAGIIDIRVTSPTGTSVAARFRYFAGSWSLTEPAAGTVGATTSTLLPSGKVLVVGGGVGHDLAELFDPSTQTWTSVAPLAHGRYGHTATLLPDGRVLVAGGADGSSVLASVEIFDPAVPGPNSGLTGRWTTAAPMAFVRLNHTAILLDGPACRGALCGKVLVAGGGETLSDGRHVYTATAELYDPTAGVWAETGRMTVPRAAHAATLLPGGTVLVTGGNIGDLFAGSILERYETTSTAESFDPATGTWQVAGSLGYRAWHTSTLLADGKVLVAGGQTSIESFYSAEVYDPALHTSTGTPRMATPRRLHTATLLTGPGCGTYCGQVLVVGGDVGQQGNRDGSAEIYDPAGRSWSTVGGMRRDRASTSASLSSTRVPTTLLADGRILLSGGTGSAFADVFDPSGRPAVPVVRKVDPTDISTLGLSRVTVSGSGFLSGSTRAVVGGEDVVVERVSDDELVARTPPSPQRGTGVVVTTPAGSSRATERDEVAYRPGTWYPAPGPGECSSSSCSARSSHTASLLDPSICHRPGGADGYPCGTTLVAGGSTDVNPNADGALASALRYDPGTGRWSAAATMAQARWDHTQTVLDGPACRKANPPPYCGKVLVVGGQAINGKPMASVELYDPRNDTWASCPEEATATATCPAPLRTARLSPTATLLDGSFCDASGPTTIEHCGDVVVVGGSSDEFYRPPLASAERYDPDTGRWSSLADLGAARSTHAAVLLPSGRLLVAGGLGINSAALGSAELYDPTADTWRSCSEMLSRPDCPGPMAVERYAPSAVALDVAPCGERCGLVLVAGGVNGAGPTDAAELYDPSLGRWMPTASLPAPVAGNTATALPDGRILMAGGGPPFHESPVGTRGGAALYDPVTATWQTAASMQSGRGQATATLLGGPACRGSAPRDYCGLVMVVGGGFNDGDGVLTATPVPLATAEIFIPGPEVLSVSPPIGPSAGGTSVTIRGSDLRNVSKVSFGGAAAASFEVRSDSEITAVTPPHPSGAVEVALVSPGGSSAMLTGGRRPFTYRPSLPPARVVDLVATALSTSKIALSFSAPASDGGQAPPASRYVVKQSSSEINDEAAFAAATSLCQPDAVCGFVPEEVGDRLNLEVNDLSPGTTFHYALRALNTVGTQGPISNHAAAATFAEAVAPPTTCADPTLTTGALIYPRGYSLIGLPTGTVVASQSPLYGWLNLGAGGAYSNSDRVQGGHGYWAWFACRGLVEPASPGTSSVDIAVDDYHAAMVGNPSATSPVSVNGHDFAARWNPALNHGAGGYSISAYREPQSLVVGEGMWVFNYVRSEIQIRAT
ncbi:MAG TPA: kelch repeat-containing protein [Acidimicrobiales bacterium]|nr:kelch repeat-containing protein [Acidimicrobiales bacterium]